jgi:hypothetical protein
VWGVKRHSSCVSLFAAAELADQSGAATRPVLLVAGGLAAAAAVYYLLGSGRQGQAGAGEGGSDAEPRDQVEVKASLKGVKASSRR